MRIEEVPGTLLFFSLSFSLEGIVVIEFSFLAFVLVEWYREIEIKLTEEYLIVRVRTLVNSNGLLISKM